MQLSPELYNRSKRLDALLQLQYSLDHWSKVIQHGLSFRVVARECASKGKAVC